MMDQKKSKIIYLGTPKIAIPPLLTLIEQKFNIVGVFCQPDKKSGRGKIIQFSPVKDLALKNNIPVFQPINKKELEDIISKIKPDLAIVFAYGIIIDQKTLEIARYGFLNIHPSLLPKYRGPSPVISAILKGEKETGVSIIKLTEKMDTGPILAQEGHRIDNDVTTEKLELELAELGSKLLNNVLPEWLEEKSELQIQDENQATYTKIFTKEDGKINWDKSAESIKNMVRAFTPWPGSYTYWDKKLIKILKARVESINSNKKIGEVFFENKLLKVKTRNGNLVIEKLQIEGKKEAAAKEFLSGYSKIIGSVLQ